MGQSSEGVRDVEENGLFLGKFPRATYNSRELPFKPGDWCLLYTDGIPETANPMEVEVGADRFKQVLETDQSISADRFADRLLEELSCWSARGAAEDLDEILRQWQSTQKSD